MSKRRSKRQRKPNHIFDLVPIQIRPEVAKLLQALFSAPFSINMSNRENRRINRIIRGGLNIKGACGDHDDGELNVDASNDAYVILRGSRRKKNDGADNSSSADKSASSKRSPEASAHHDGDDPDHDQCNDESACRTHIVGVLGEGSEVYDFPSVEELVQRVANRVFQILLEQAQAGLKEAQKMKGNLEAYMLAIPDMATFLDSIYDSKIGKKADPLNSIERNRAVDAGKNEDAETLDESDSDPAFERYIEYIKEVFRKGKVEALVDSVLSPVKEPIAISRRFDATHGEYNDVLDSSLLHLDKIRELFIGALPLVAGFLEAVAPEASSQEILRLSLTLLIQELQDILYVMVQYSTAFQQMNDGGYHHLTYIKKIVHQFFNLYRTGNIDGHCDEACQARLNRGRRFHVGDKFLALSGESPATIPGSELPKGLPGVHLLFIPPDEKKNAVSGSGVYGHESGHDFSFDIAQLPEARRAVAVLLDKVFKEGQFLGKEFKLSDDFVRLGNQRVPAALIAKQYFTDTISESVSDILVTCAMGPAFGYNLLGVFSAYNTQDASIWKKPLAMSEMAKPWLRTDSYYVRVARQNGQQAIMFAVHPHDYLRAYIIAAVLEFMGLAQYADDIRRLADIAVCTEENDGEEVIKTPEYLTWSDRSKNKSKVEIAMKTEDLKKLAPVLAYAVMYTPMDCFGGVSFVDLVSWNQERQDIVDVLANVLMAKGWPGAEAGVARKEAFIQRVMNSIVAPKGLKATEKIATLLKAAIIENAEDKVVFSSIYISAAAGMAQYRRSQSGGRSAALEAIENRACQMVKAIKVETMGK